MTIAQNKYYKLAFAMMHVSKAINAVSEMLGQDDELNEWVAELNSQHGGLNLLPMSCDEYASVWATACYEAESRGLLLDQTNAAAMEDVAIAWDDPAAHAALVERIGLAAYNKAHEKYRESLVVETVAGHAIRMVSSSFGKLFAVGDTKQAYVTIEDARGYAQANPAPLASNVPFDGRKS